MDTGEWLGDTNKLPPAQITIYAENMGYSESNKQMYKRNTGRAV